LDGAIPGFQFGRPAIMTPNPRALIDRLAIRRATAACGRMAEDTAAMAPERLDALRADARLLRRRLGEVVLRTDSRLSDARPLPVPLSADWSFRPAVFCGALTPSGSRARAGRTPVGPDAALFHDCPREELSFRQRRTAFTSPGAVWGLRLDIFAFEGSFLSLVVDLPQEALEGLSQRHILRLEVMLEAETPVRVFARLNIAHGPNTEALVRIVPQDGPRPTVEFDLTEAGIDEARVEKVWADLIFEAPAMNRITLSDMALSRRPRAEP